MCHSDGGHEGGGDRNDGIDDVVFDDADRRFPSIAGTGRAMTRNIMMVPLNMEVRLYRRTPISEHPYIQHPV